MANNVITDIESKTKATSFLNLSSLFFIIGYFIVAYMLRGLVNSILTIPYLIFSLLCSVYLIWPSRFNKGRNNLESIGVLFMGDKTVYRPYMRGEDNG